MAIGYACIVVHSSSGFSLKSCSLKSVSDDKLMEITAHNLKVLENIIDYNIKNGIKLFRISSDIIPFGSHSVNSQRWWDVHKEHISRIGQKIRSSGIRVSMHPGQYTVLNSKDPNVVQKAVSDLIYHTRFLESLNTDSTSKIILHIGGVYEDKYDSMKRFSENYNKLPGNVKDKLVIENDERCYNISDVLTLGKENNIPVVFDNLHHKLNPPRKAMPDSYWISICGSTWKEKDGRQKIHYSQQDLIGKPGAHSKTISLLEFLNYYESVDGRKLDIMLEVKDKNISALKCVYSTIPSLPVKYIEAEWSRYKYLVLSHSQQMYLEIRKLLKNKSENTVLQFYKYIEAVLSNEPSVGDEINAANHVWGYFKKISDSGEQKKIMRLTEDYKNNNTDIKSIKRFLLRLAIKYDIVYLIDSYYFIQ